MESDVSCWPTTILSVAVKLFSVVDINIILDSIDCRFIERIEAI